MKLYHIHRRDNLDELYVPGKTFEVGKDYNQMTKLQLELSPTEMRTEGKNREPFDFFIGFSPEFTRELDVFGINELCKNGYFYAYNMKILVREYILELARLSVNPEAPSRFNCMWLTDNMALDYWKEYLRGFNKNVFEVETDDQEGNLFLTSARLLPDPTKSQIKMIDQAKRYWDPSKKDLKVVNSREYLYTGNVKILSKLK